MNNYRPIRFVVVLDLFAASAARAQQHPPTRQRISINEGWKFMRYTSDPDKLIYDERPGIANRRENEIADARPPIKTASGGVVLVRVVERAIVDGINGNIAVIAPAIGRACLATGAIK